MNTTENSQSIGGLRAHAAAGDMELPAGRQQHVDRVTIISADVHEGLKRIAEKSVHCVVTSPPYWGLRSYLPKGHPLKHLEIGQEKKPDCLAWAKGEPPCGECFVCTMRSVFGGKQNPVGVWRVLRDDGTVWLNLGDCYSGSGRGIGDTKTNNKGNPAARDFHDDMVESGAIGRAWTKPPQGLKCKDLCMVPMRVALALQADGWYLRSDIIWAKRNCMPESVTDRPTRSHEYLFLLSKSPRYFYDAEAIKEPCIYEVDGTGTAARKARASEELKSHPIAERNGLRAGGYKNSVNFEGNNKGNDKQRGHSRRHDGFNSRWDAMESLRMATNEQCTGMRNKRDVWRPAAEANLFRWLEENAPATAKEFLSQSCHKKDVFEVSPANYPEAHFATFPPELIKPCILAGTSGGGACAECGSPMQRKIEVGSQNLEHQKACGGDANGEYDGESTKDHAEHGVQDASAVKARVLAGMRERKTIGWAASCGCQCSDKTEPCIVLDPFGGSGTTGEVSLELGRRAILIELNPEYLPLIERRTNVTPGLQL